MSLSVEFGLSLPNFQLEVKFDAPRHHCHFRILRCRENNLDQYLGRPCQT